MPLPPVDHRLKTDDSPVILDAIAQFGRRLPDGVLVFAAAIGVCATTAIFILWPARWQFTLPLLTIVCFAIWGVTDRAIADSARRADAARSPSHLLPLLRFVAGAAAASAMVATIIALLTGTIITTGSGWF